MALPSWLVCIVCLCMLGELGARPASAQSAAEELVKEYAEHTVGRTTDCYHGRNVGVCWDLAACAVMQGAGLPSVPWDCRNRTEVALGLPASVPHGLGTRDDYKDRPNCYVFGDDIAPPGGNWEIIWDLVPRHDANVRPTFHNADVRPGDILQLDNYTALCNGTVWESTDEGPHTAVIVAVGDRYLTVCQQNWNQTQQDMCGWEFFTFTVACHGPWTYSFDAMHVYRPAVTAGGHGPVCDKCYFDWAEALV